MLGTPYFCYLEVVTFANPLARLTRLCAEEAYAETLHGGSFEILAY